MGSYSSTNVDEVELWGSKSEVDEDSLSIFLERDRRVRPDPSQDPEDYDRENAYLAELIEYAVPAQEMRERLDALGFTLERARADHGQCHAAECDMIRELVEDGASFTSADELRELEKMTFDRWQEAIAAVAGEKIPLWHRERLEQFSDAKALRYDHDYGVRGSFSDPRLFLRAYLDALPSAIEVVLDVTDLVHGGYYEP